MTILTFSNHPRSIIHPPAPKLIIPYKEKLALLRPFADLLISLPFTEELATTDYADLLSRFDPSEIVLGEGTVFGKNREGTEKNVRDYGERLGIRVEYIPKLFFENEPISSSRIREALAKGKIDLAHQLLGRDLL